MLDIDLLKIEATDFPGYSENGRFRVHMEFTYHRNDDILQNHCSIDYSHLTGIAWGAVYTRMAADGEPDIESHVGGWAPQQQVLQKLGEDQFRLEGYFDDNPVVRAILEEIRLYHAEKRFSVPSPFGDSGQLRRLLDALKFFWA